MTETNSNIVKIHGKDYMTVAGRVQLAHEQLKKISVSTEVLPVQGAVVVKATVTTDKGTFTGISAANPSKAIEKQSPYEVAETSAVGRALGFAGFGAVDSIASADEVVKANNAPLVVNSFEEALQHKGRPVSINPHVEKALGQICPDCGEGTIVLNPKTQKLFCDHKCWLNKEKVPEEVDDEDVNPNDIPF